jgi:phage shock protein PspC (stress-responsive transcriptional regulator)
MASKKTTSSITDRIRNSFHRAGDAAADYVGDLRSDKKLRLARKGRMFGGVCKGLSDYLGVPVAILRIATIVGLFFVAPVIVPAYFLFWLVTPRAAKPRANARRQLGQVVELEERRSATSR